MGQENRLIVHTLIASWTITMQAFILAIITARINFVLNLNERGTC